MNKRQRKKQYSVKAWARRLRKTKRRVRDYHGRWMLMALGPYPLPFKIEGW